MLAAFEPLCGKSSGSFGRRGPVFHRFDDETRSAELSDGDVAMLPQILEGGGHERAGHAESPFCRAITAAIDRNRRKVNNQPSAPGESSDCSLSPCVKANELSSLDSHEAPRT